MSSIIDNYSRENTLIMDTTITQVGALQSEFVKPAGQSWLARFIK